MKTELKDVIHFYLGCEGSSKNGGTFVGKLVSIDTVGGICILKDKFDIPVCIPITEVELHLRSLSSMTEEEAREWQDRFRFFLSGSHEYIKARLYVIQEHIAHPETRFSNEQFVWLLSKGFDLFGLIESSQALEKKVTS